MAGQIKMMIDSIIAKKTRGNPTVANVMKAKLIIKGINPKNYTPVSPDDPAIIAKLQKLAIDMGVTL